MATFLPTSGVSYHLERIIKEANDKLYLVSPYLKVNDRLRQLLEDKDKFKIDMRVIYGKAELQSDESAWLNSLSSLRLMYCKNLHAKCFLNESEAVLTSMNLYEFSQVNNEEMGILVSRADDLSLYTDISDDVMRLMRFSEESRITVEVVKENKTPKAKRSGKPADKTKVPTNGHCIRCRTTIKANPLRPYCRSCFYVWNQNADEHYEDKVCHFCGKDNPSTLNKPNCYPCYKKYRADFEFAPVTVKK